MVSGRPRRPGGDAAGAAGVLAVAVPAAVMLGLGLWDLDRGGTWRDEAVTLQVARRSVPQIWRLLHGVDAVHGLYYLFMHAVLAVPGSGVVADEVLLRLPSVVAASAAAGLVAALGSRLARPRVGLWAGLLYAITPMVGHYAQEGRSYALVAAGAAGATLWLAKALDGRSWWPYAVLVAVTCLLHELAVLMLPAHAVTLALARAVRREWCRWAAAAGGALLLVSPLALLSGRQSGQVAWLTPPDAGAAQRLLWQFTGRADWASWVYVGLVVVAATALRRSALVRVALPLAVLPPLALMALSQVRPMYDDRYVLFALAGAPLLAAAGADRVLPAAAPGPPDAVRAVRPPAVALAGVSAVALAFVGQLPLYRLDRDPGRRPDNLTAVAALAARELAPGDPVVFLPAIGRRPELAYPRAFRRARDVALKVPGPASGTLYGVEVDAPVLRRRLDAVDRLWVVAEPYALRSSWYPGDPAERLKLTVVNEEFVPFEPRREFVRGGTVLRLYVRRPAPAGPPRTGRGPAGPFPGGWSSAGPPRVAPPAGGPATGSRVFPPALPRPAPW
ncbi:glycosyltransferase family 39 protein [Streptomyces sp. NPDC059766]|uniref:glycosyltransferase family 39 protein n=1 Tax=Streptomyces sp. NPDC059766 TaxID=3346940 RepID=UPI0036651372